MRQRVAIAPAPASERSARLLVADPGFAPAPAPWQQVSVLGDGETLEIFAVHGSLQRLHAVDVDESLPDVVLIRLWLAFAEPPSPGARTAVGYPFRTRIRLSRPLAGRAAVDGALGTEEDVREHEIDQAVRWRHEMGLPTARRLVAELVDLARMPDGRLYGHEVMSDDEDRRYRQAVDDKETAAEFAKSWLADQDADLDGHAEITWHGGGDFVQYVTGGADALRTAAAAAGIRRLRVESVAYTYRELERIHQAARDRLTAAGLPLRRSGPDVRANRVALTVDGGEAAAAEARRLIAGVAPLDAVEIISAVDGAAG